MWRISKADIVRISAYIGANGTGLKPETLVFVMSVQWSMYFIDSVDHTKLSYYTPTEAVPQFLYKIIPVFCESHFYVLFPLKADQVWT